MYCPMCGEKIYNIMEFCPYCDTKLNEIRELLELSEENIYKQFIPQILEKEKKFSINGEVLVFKGHDFLRRRYLAVSENLNYFNQSQCKELLKKFDKFDSLVENGISELIAILGNNALIIYYLIDDIDKQEMQSSDFVEFFLEKVGLQEMLEQMEKATQSIDIAVEKIAQRRQVQIERKNNKHWVGGGFGFSGAIRGSMQAAILNMGSDIMHSVSNAATASILNMNDKAVINNIKKEIYNGGRIQQIFDKTIKKLSLINYSYVNNILKKKYGMASNFEEDAFDIGNKVLELKKKINIDKIQGEEREKAIKLYILLLKVAPNKVEIYSGIYELKKELGEDLVHMAKYFGIGRPVMENMLKIDYQKLTGDLSTIVNDNLYRKKLTEGVNYIKSHNPAFKVNYDSEEKDRLFELEKKINR